MQEHHITHEMLRKAAGLGPCKRNGYEGLLDLARTCLLGCQPIVGPKQMFFGWWKGRTIKANTWTAQSRWLERCLQDAHILVGDWFRSH